MIHYITDFFAQFPASSYYHALAFLSTAFLTQYSVQIVKLLSKYSLGKWLLRSLNATFATLYVGAEAWISGGLSAGNLTKSALAMTALSTWVYWFHNNAVYKKFDAAITEETDKPEPKEDIPQFAS